MKGEDREFEITRRVIREGWRKTTCLRLLEVLRQMCR
jgi:hypothetical protein